MISVSPGVIASLAFGVSCTALGGLFYGETGERSAARASRFATPEVARVVREACESKAPFAVLDTFAVFKPVNIDETEPAPEIDERKRLLHGDVVAAISEASHRGTIAYQTEPIFNVRTLATDFARLADDVESGRIPKPAAIVSSIVLPLDLLQVNARLRPEKPFGQEDVLTRKRELLELLAPTADLANPYARIDAQMGRFRQAGVPVFVAAGNSGPDQTINALALSEGVYAVGSLDRDGRPTLYTSAPGMVSIWSPGFVVITDAPGGLSVSGGANVELAGADLPEQRAVIARYSGKRATDVALPAPYGLRQMTLAGPSRQRRRHLAITLEPGIYRTEDLMAAYGYPESSGTFARAVADGPYMHYPSDTIFQTNVDDELVFDPIGDRSEGQLQVADATSFAAPNICAAELFRSRASAHGTLN